MNYSNQLKLLAFLILFTCAQASRADFNDGVVAYMMGEYDKAYATMRSLADTADHAYAQYYVGMMYFNGQGVKQDYEEAGSWFIKSARHGIPQAQYKLGQLYSKGQGMPKDFESAYAWYSVGAQHQHKKSIDALGGIKDMLSDEELKEAEKLSADLIAKYGPKADELGKIKQIDNE